MARHVCLQNKIWLKFFFSLSNFATCIFFYNEPELGTGIDPGMALTPCPSSISDETRFEPTTFQS